MEQFSTSYKSIVKGTAAFGGVQIFNIFINLIRGKFVAILLGAEGMGIASLLTAAANTIQQFFSLGLNLSIVKEVSKAHKEGDHNLLSTVVLVTKRFLHITSILGALFTILFSSYLSQWTFGSDTYKWHFIFLSIMIYFTTLSNGELSILQGIHAIKKLAYASIIGSVTGLLVGVPFYYFFGYNGIVPAMIVLSLSVFAFYHYHRSRLIPIDNYSKSWKDTTPLAKKMLMLGIVMMAASLLGTLSNYILNAFISNYGSLNDVGLYQAANSITNQYAGLIFTAISLDFLPRLSAISSNNTEIRKLVNQQSEIIILAIAPLAILLMITAPLIIRILLTKEFLSLIPVVRIMGLGLFFKAIAFPMGYISFSKGDKKTFFWLEGIGGNLLTLILNCTFFIYWGIVGIGISFVLSYAIFNLIYIFITKRLYSFSHSKECKSLILPLAILLIASLLCSFIPNQIYAYSLMALFLLIITIYSLHELNKRLNLFNFKLFKKK